MKTEKQSLRFRVGVVCMAVVLTTTGRLNAQEKHPLQPTVGNSYASAENDLAIQGTYIVNSPSSIALKTNLLYATTLTPNLALEIGLGKKTSIEIGGGYNFYKTNNDKHWKHWLVQPEFRYWFCERFNGSFIGVQALGGEYNFSKLHLPFGLYKGLRNHRYEGYYYGGGLVFGHQWILSKRWNFELSAGVGYIRAHYDKYECTSCGSSVANGFKNYWGPTKASISFLLFL